MAVPGAASGPLLARLGIAAGAAGIGIVGAKTGLDIMKERFKALNMPSWQAQGQAKAYGTQAGALRFARAQETLLKGYDTAYNVFDDTARGMASGLLGEVGDMRNQYRVRKSFDKIKSDPIVRAMGIEKARDIYNQIGKLAPDVVRHAPSTTLPAIQGAMVSDSMHIPVDMAMNMAKTQGYVSPKRR